VEPGEAPELVVTPVGVVATFDPTPAGAGGVVAGTAVVGTGLGVPVPGTVDDRSRLGVPGTGTVVVGVEADVDNGLWTCVVEGGAPIDVSTLVSNPVADRTAVSCGRSKLLAVTPPVIVSAVASITAASTAVRELLVRPGPGR
jgi:hypothetical protein